MLISCFCCSSGAGASTTSFSIAPVPRQSAVLQEYVETGNRLKKSACSGMVEIEDGIKGFMEEVKATTPQSAAVFAYADGSSGLGKTQLAFALLCKTLFLPQGE